MSKIIIRRGYVPSLVTWTQQGTTAGWPGYNGYLELLYDTLANRTLLYGVPAGSSSIYSTNLYTYESAANAFVKLGGNDAMANTCTDTSGSGWPGDRHPVGQIAWDASRNGFWMWGGVCGGNNWLELWFFFRGNNTWTKLTPATTPNTQSSGAMVYSPDDDVIYMFGSDGGPQTHTNWVYCPTASRSAAQIAAGCAAGQDWTEVSVVGGVQPAGVAFPRLVYNPVLRRVLMYGGNTGGGTTQNQTWSYNIPTKTWTQRALSTTAPTLYNGPGSPPTFALVVLPSGYVVYHQTHGSGAPRDWRYDPWADTWTVISSSGSGPTNDTMAAFDVSAGKIITYGNNAGSPRIWHGVVSY